MSVWPLHSVCVATVICGFYVVWPLYVWPLTITGVNFCISLVLELVWGTCYLTMVWSKKFVQQRLALKKIKTLLSQSATVFRTLQALRCINLRLTVTVTWWWVTLTLASVVIWTHTHCSLKCSLLFGHSSLIGFNQFLSKTIHTRVKNVIWHYGFLRRLDKLHWVNQQSFAIRWRHWRRWFITLQRRCRPWSTVNWWQTRQLLVYVRSWHDGESLSTLEVTNVSLRICLSKQFLSYTRSKACSCKASSSIHQ